MVKPTHRLLATDTEGTVNRHNTLPKRPLMELGQLRQLLQEPQAMVSNQYSANNQGMASNLDMASHLGRWAVTRLQILDILLTELLLHSRALEV